MSNLATETKDQEHQQAWQQVEHVEHVEHAEHVEHVAYTSRSQLFQKCTSRSCQTKTKAAWKSQKAKRNGGFAKKEATVFLIFRIKGVSEEAWHHWSSFQTAARPSWCPNS
jgi:hypothetical protein